MDSAASSVPPVREGHLGAEELLVGRGLTFGYEREPVLEGVGLSVRA